MCQLKNVRLVSILAVLACALSAAFSERGHAATPETRERAAFRVDLSFDPPYQITVANAFVDIDLHAALDDPNLATQEISAIDAILSWDPNYLELVAIDSNDAGYAWLQEGFPANPDGLNDGGVPWDPPANDGDAMYTALALPTPLAPVDPPPGLLVTTFRFRALAPTTETSLSLIDQFGAVSETRVLTPLSPPNDNVTGDISSTAIVRVVPEGCPGDCDCDGDRDFDDINFFVAALGPTGEQSWIALHLAEFGQPPSCGYIPNCFPGGDFSGAIPPYTTFENINPFVALLGVPCP